MKIPRSLFNPATVAAALFGIGCSESVPEQSLAKAQLAIRNGVPAGAEFDKTIFSVASQQPESYGTGTNVMYPRCILTAGHNGAGMVGTGADQRQGVITQQNVAARVARGTNKWTDLAVLWLENKRSTAAQPRMQSPGDYQPERIIASLGLGNTQLRPNGTEDPNVLSPGAPIIALIFGYGGNSSQGGQDVGQFVRRWGSMNATHFFEHANQINVPTGIGGYYLLVANDDPQQANASCKGDSGGPATKNGGITQGIFGVIHAGVNPLCGSNIATRVTALDKSAPAGEKSNWDWVQDAFENTCKKNLIFDILGPGLLSGAVTPLRRPDSNDLWRNGLINCGIGVPVNDCVEYLHDQSADGDDMQTITVSAEQTNPLFPFIIWGKPPGQRCPCYASTDPNCFISYDTVGEYTEDSSSDTAHCVAMFDWDPFYCPDVDLGCPRL
jgi:hypothetical protein